MPVKIELPDKYADKVANLYMDIYMDIIRRRNDLEDEMQQITPMLKSLGVIQEDDFLNNFDRVPDSIKSYVKLLEDQLQLAQDKLIELFKKMPWLEKVKFVLSEGGGALDMSEIIKGIERYEPESIERINKSVPPTISTAVAEGKLYRLNEKGADSEYSIAPF